MPLESLQPSGCRAPLPRAHHRRIQMLRRAAATMSSSSGRKRCGQTCAGCALPARHARAVVVSVLEACRFDLRETLTAEEPSMAHLRRALHAFWRQLLRLAKMLFMLALIALPVPVAALVVALVCPRRNPPRRCTRKSEVSSAHVPPQGDLRPLAGGRIALVGLYEIEGVGVRVVNDRGAVRCTDRAEVGAAIVLELEAPRPGF